MQRRAPRPVSSAEDLTRLESPACSSGESQAALSSRLLRPSLLAPWAAALSCLLFCGNSELLQSLQRGPLEADQRHASPLLNLALCHLGGLLFVPYFLCGAGRACATIDDKAPLVPSGSGVARSSLASSPCAAALVFALLLMSYNYAWLRSATLLAAGLTNAIFLAVSVALVYLASVFLFAEAVTPGRLLGIALALGGSMLASGGGRVFTSGGGVGVALAFAAAGGYTVYQILFRYVFSHLKQDVAFLAYFGAWVSAWHVIAIFPMILLADFTGYETLEFPRGRSALLCTLASALIASTVNALNLCVVMWGSPMLLPSTSAFSVPLIVFLDFVLHEARPRRSELLGHSLVVLSVVLIMQLGSSSSSLGRSLKQYPNTEV